MYGLIGAMALEIEQLLSEMTDRTDKKIGMDVFSSGKLYGKDVVLAVCGPGKVNAAICAMSMIREYAPEWVLNLGVAGAGDETVGIGDMVIAEAAVQHDMDTSPIGDPVGYISKVGLVQLPCDAALREKLLAAAAGVPGMKTVTGIIATGDQFICRAEDRTRIHSLYQARAVEMEGGAVAHACCVMGVPCGIVRSISDCANGESTMDYPTFAKLAAAHSAAVVAALLKAEA